MAALDPALGLLSALTSLPAALYYARALGAAAVHPVRHADGRIAGVRTSAGWMRTLLLFLGGTGFAAAAVTALNMAVGSVASLHAAFGAVLIVTLWPHAREITVRVLLLFLLISAGVARILPAAQTPGAVVIGCAIGLVCAWMLHRYAARRAHG